MLKDADLRLCSRCSAIDFETLLSKTSVSKTGDTVLKLESAADLTKDSQCPFCQALAFICPSSWFGDEKKSLRLVFSARTIDRGFWPEKHYNAHPADIIFAFSFAYNNRPLNRHEHIDTWASNSTHWSVPGTGCLKQAASKKHTVPHLADSIPEKISMDMLKRWMTQSESESLYGLEATKPVENLWFINCETREIIHAPFKAQYVALSYVWGQSTTASEDMDHGILKSNLPRTIEDAISVTRSLGQQYLWIDRYCIPSDDREQQISRMHDIYEGAHFTIIAAAGEDPHYGLPGVSSRGRARPAPLRIGPHLLGATFPSPKLVTEVSKWHTRGWTYQEGLLSRRNLVFTDHQVFLQCDHSAFFESPVQYRSPRLDETIARHKPIENFFNLATNYRSVRESPWDHIRNYTTLDLTDPNDAINGMLGILNFYRDHECNPRVMEILKGHITSTDPNRNYQLRHIAGLPISWCEDEICGLSERLEWAIPIALFWRCKKPSDRRPGVCFPSWSWAGWHCQCYAGLYKSLDYIAGASSLHPKGWAVVGHTPRAPSILLYEKDDVKEARKVSVVELRTLEEMLDEKYDISGVRYLKITAPTVSAKVVPYPRDKAAMKPDRAQLDNTRQTLALDCGGIASLIPLNLTSKVIFKEAVLSGNLSCLALALNDDIRVDIGYWRDSTVIFLLIMTERDNCFERIGVAMVGLKEFRQAGPVELSIKLG